MTIIEKNYKWADTMTKRTAVKRIILHHAAAKKCSAEDIHAWHIANGWAGIGYHFLVRKDGTVYRGRPIDVVGAHTYGKNTDSIGICFEGNFETEKMGDTQKKAGIELVSYLMAAFPTVTEVSFHRDFNSTACPGKNFPYSEMKEIKAAVNSEKPNVLRLEKEPLYISSTAKEKSGTVTGTYYIWGGGTVNGRIRITNKAERIGVSGQVTGWIKAPANTKTIHTVVKGDTLGALAKKYCTTVKAIVDENIAAYPKMTDNYIVCGWKLVIPA